MRGAVSLAAALALPLTPTPGTPLPGRELIQFITFALILVTVVGQGLTLPWLIRRLGVIDDGTEEEREEIRARLVIARAALDRVDELEDEDWTRDGTVERVRRLYEFRQRRFKIRAGKIEDEDGLEEGSLLYQRMMHEIYAAQRQALSSCATAARSPATSCAASSASSIWRSRAWRSEGLSPRRPCPPRAAPSAAAGPWRWPGASRRPSPGRPRP